MWPEWFKQEYLKKKTERSQEVDEKVEENGWGGLEVGKVMKGRTWKWSLGDTLLAHVPVFDDQPAISDCRRTKQWNREAHTFLQHPVLRPSSSRAATGPFHYCARRLSHGGACAAYRHFDTLQFLVGYIRAVTFHCTFSRVLKQNTHSEICHESWIWVILRWI